VLGDRGLEEALRAAARNSPLAVSIRASAVGRLPEDIETAVYFACVEALQNAAKHAQRETSVLISLRQGKTLLFEVRDDGVGFAVDSMPAGAGLANMRDRIEAIGGRLAIESAAGQGTCVSGSVPLR
jgi:signal transduction histidine kinase